MTLSFSVFPRLFIFLALLFVVNNSPAASPSDYFDLTNWKITLPISKDAVFGSGSNTSPAEIFPDYHSSYNSTRLPLNNGFEWGNIFFTSNGKMVFRTELNGGSTTSNSSRVRTELRELYSSKNQNWVNSGVHIMEGRLRITQDFSDAPKIVFAQIHAVDAKPLVKLQWYGNNKQIKALVNNYPNDDSDPEPNNSDNDIHYLDFAEVQKNDEIHYVIKLENDALTITVNGINQSVSFGEADVSMDWENQQFYFKAGNYPQYNAAQYATSGGIYEVQYESLKTSHDYEDIWKPIPRTSWQWQLINSIDTSFNVEMYDIDLFDVDSSVISSLKTSGKKVVCYFSAGSYENWRDDKDLFTSDMLGNQLDGYADENWLDVRHPGLKSIMSTRLDLAVTKGCDGVEPDNMDGFTNQPGFNYSGDDQLAYNRWLAREARARGLSVGLKNDLSQVQELVDDFDWALNEQCYEYNECDLLMPFIDANKAVFGVEYVEEGGDPAEYCPDANSRGFSWLQKTEDLTAEVLVDCLSYENANGVPYDQIKFNSTLNASKLQAPDSTKVVEAKEFENYASDFFFLDNANLMSFRMSGNKKRSELRQLEEWKATDGVGNSLYGRLKIDGSNEADQFTFMQLHDKQYSSDSDKYVEGSPNKPLVRLYWQRVRGSVEDHLWAAVYTELPSDESIEPEKIDLGARPDGFFEANISLRDDQLHILIKAPEYTKSVIRDVAFWRDFYSYFKAGVYLQSEGLATVKYDQLRFVKGIPFMSGDTWDIDGDNTVSPLTDGLLIIRYLFDFKGATLISDALSTHAVRETANEIESFLVSVSSTFDIDDDGDKRALTDGVLILRYLFGFRGDALTTGAVNSSGERLSSSDIELYIRDILGR